MELREHIFREAFLKGFSIHEDGKNLVLVRPTNDVTWSFYIDLDGTGECSAAEREKYFRVREIDEVAGMFESIEEHL